MEDCPKSRRSVRRVYVLGFDGMTLDLIEPWVEDDARVVKDRLGGLDYIQLRSMDSYTLLRFVYWIDGDKRSPGTCMAGSSKTLVCFGSLKP